MTSSLPTASSAEAGERSSRAAQVARAAAFVVSIGLVAAAQRSFTNPVEFSQGWWLALAAVVVAGVWQFRLPIADWKHAQDRVWLLAPQLWRRLVGGLVTLGGLALWAHSTWILYLDWNANFDRAWLGWVAAAAATSMGFLILQVPSGPATGRLGRWERAVLVAAFVAAAAFRLGNYQNYPPNDAVSQIEELQTGAWATDYINGGRSRWEFLGQMWVGALGLEVGGTSMRAVRMAFSVVSLLKVVPAYFWFRSLAGPVGGMVGTAILALSGWDTIHNRIPGHQDGLVLVCCMALLTGPAVRRVWAAYPWIALLAGYEIYSYIAYRPLIAFALVGVLIAASVRRQVGERRWPRQLGAALLVTALIAAMFVPLTSRLSNGRLVPEYLNGWNRAHAVEEYYGPKDSWSVALSKRWQRISVAANLFYTLGDTNATHNVDGRPMVDAATGSLLLFGIGYCALQCLQGFYGLSLAALLIVFIGTLVATGNFDVLRSGAMIPYLYAVVAIGAGSVYAAARRTLPRFGRHLVVLALAGGVSWAGYWNGKLLLDLWASPVTRRNYRNDLAYLSSWLHDNARGQYVIGLIPSGASVVFLNNDASWLRGPEVKGESRLDIAGTLRTLMKARGENMLLIAVPDMKEDLLDFFRYAIPGLQLKERYDEESHGIRMAYGYVSSADIARDVDHLRKILCTGVHAHFDLRRADESVIASFSAIVPFVDYTTFPEVVRRAVFQHDREGRWIDGTWEATFDIDEAHAGEYLFWLESYEGPVSAQIDGRRLVEVRETPVMLAAGTHHFQARGRFNAVMMEPSARLLWRGTRAETQQARVPFYRLTATDEACLAGQAGPTATGPRIEP